jgi:hypothetical protein
MFVVFGSVLQLLALVNAFIRSLKERFVVGTVGALVRAALLLSGVIGAVWSRFVHFPGSDVAAPATASLMALGATVLGPVVSFAVLWIAYRRKKDVPAAHEERLGRPFNAWLPVALLDAAFVLINVLATVFTSLPS